MKRYELKIPIANDRLRDELVLALIDNGYEVYTRKEYGEAECVYFSIAEDEMHEIREQ